MSREEFFEKLSVQTETKIVLVVLDGLGGLPLEGKTELETAATPNLDKLAADSELGQTFPVGIGITPGSGPAHLSLFGYDPLRYDIGRGILEALGVGVQVGAGEVTSRGNFATLSDGLITDRRAGRISSEHNQRLIGKLSAEIREIQGVKITLHPGEEHRFVLVLQGKDLDDSISDADPGTVAKALPIAEPLRESAGKTAAVVNEFIDRAIKVLKECQPANAVLLRGFAKPPDIPTISELYKLRPAALATYPMYRGLARLVGMTVLEAGQTVFDEVAALKKHYHEYDYFFLHVKKTDSYGEDGNFAAKVKVIEEFDSVLPDILALKPDVLAITGDHSTPALLSGHSWHPNPLLVHSPYVRCRASESRLFNEYSCANGVLGSFLAMELMPLLLANTLKLKKYGA